MFSGNGAGNVNGSCRRCNSVGRYSSFSTLLKCPVLQPEENITDGDMGANSVLKSACVPTIKRSVIDGGGPSASGRVPQRSFAINTVPATTFSFFASWVSGGSASSFFPHTFLCAACFNRDPKGRLRIYLLTKLSDDCVATASRTSSGTSRIRVHRLRHVCGEVGDETEVVGRTSGTLHTLVGVDALPSALLGNQGNVFYVW